jgi:hypothetical protein
MSCLISDEAIERTLPQTYRFDHRTIRKDTNIQRHTMALLDTAHQPVK